MNGHKNISNNNQGIGRKKNTKNRKNTMCVLRPLIDNTMKDKNRKSLAQIFIDGGPTYIVC